MLFRSVSQSRYPAEWSHIEKNLRKIDQLPKNVYAWLAYTVTALNVYHLPEFMLWKLEQGYTKINSSKKKPIITHHVAHHPQSLNVRVLPKDVKQDIKNHFNSCKSLFLAYGEEIHANAVSILDSVINYMMDGDLSDHYDSFIRDTVKLDKIRGQPILDVVPQYRELFNGK